MNKSQVFPITYYQFSLTSVIIYFVEQDNAFPVYVLFRRRIILRHIKGHI